MGSLRHPISAGHTPLEVVWYGTPLSLSLSSLFSNIARFARPLAASYLVTYTFTQLVDIVLWLRHENHALRSCPSMVETFNFPDQLDEPGQYTNYVVTKYVLPLVVFTQYWQQLSYPSEILKEHRTKLKLLFLSTSIGMHYQFGCTDVVTATFPTNHETLRWGGVENETSHVLIVVAITTFFYWLLMDSWRVRVAHTVTFWSVVGGLWFTEGTLALGSKCERTMRSERLYNIINPTNTARYTRACFTGCTYCLIFSFVYLTDPWWNVAEGKKKKGE